MSGFCRICFGVAVAVLAPHEPAAAQSLYMPPNEYIRPFPGKVTVMNLPHKEGSPMLSLSGHANGQCAIWLSKIGEPGITEALYECLAVIEVANCNGATDINTPAVRARMFPNQRGFYARQCAGRSWRVEFDKVGLPK